MFLPSILAFLSLFFLASEAKVTCYNCRSYNCQTGSCEGEFCSDQFTHNADMGTTSFQRGCYSPLAGVALRSMNSKFDCSGSQLGDIRTSTCVCQSDHCNGGDIHKANVTGSVKCATGKVGSVSGSCNGDSCRRGDQGLGCQSDHDFTNYQPFFPPGDFNGCYKITSAGKTDEECSCKTDNCNAGPQNTTYNRNLISCNETEPFSSESKLCSGHACFINGADLKGGNGYRRGCVMVSGEEPIPTFCTSLQTSGSNNQQQACLCTDDKCNLDVATAIQSIMKTTTTTTATTTITTTAATTEVTSHKAAASLLPSALVLAAAAFCVW